MGVRDRPPMPHRAHKTCSFCGLHPVPGRRRNWCGDGCARLWASTGDSGVAYNLLIADGVPEECRFCLRVPEWPEVLEVEHVRPLWSLSEIERGQIRWWLPSNLQLLCPTCHKAKSAVEAGQRAGGVWSPYRPGGVNLKGRVEQPSLFSR